MGMPISRAEERQIRRLLRRGKSLLEIGRHIGCDRKTVRRVRDGVRVRRPPAGTTVIRQCAAYICLDCSDLAGRAVETVYTPCVACLAREALAARRLASSGKGSRGGVLQSPPGD